MVHYAAGILPVAWHDSGGGPPQLLVLVGKDVRGDQSWSDFGGKCERVDKGCMLNTACREFYEETLGCVVDAKSLRHRLVPGNCISLRSTTQNGHPYHMFVVEIPYIPHLRNTFRKFLGFLRFRNLGKLFVEKVDVQFVPWATLRGGELVKRSVFQRTLDAHRDVLDKLAAGGPTGWARVSAEHAP